MPAQIASNDPMRRFEMRNLITPVLMTAQKAVHEDNRRQSRAFINIVQGYIYIIY